MARKRLAIAVAAVLVLAVAMVSVLRARSAPLVLTGIVTTNDVIVSPQIGGQVESLLVSEGDSVARNQLLAVIAPAELAADQAYFAHSAAGVASQVQESEANLRYQEQQAEHLVRQAEAMLAADSLQYAEAKANLEMAQLMYERQRALGRDNISSATDVDRARTTYDAAKARAEAASKQLDAQRAALGLARAAVSQVAAKRGELGVAKQQEAASAAQSAKARVRLSYAEVRAPIAGVVEVRAVRPGEVVTPGQPVVTIVNPDDLWVRADVEETYIDRVRIGDRLTVRLPSGETRVGTVYYRGVDANFATQRDVSRTKRDIKTFEICLRVENRDRRLAVGMTAYVLFPTAS